MSTVTMSFSLDDQSVAVIESLAKERRFSKSDAVRELARQYQLQLLLKSAQAGMKDVAKDLGIESEDDVERVFG